VATSMVRVLAVDDFESFRRFAASQLGKRPELQIIGEASDGSEAVRKAEELQPDLILLDIGLPKLNGIEAARQIRKHSPVSKILFLSQDSSVETVLAALDTGAAGYIVKSDAGRELLPAIDAILRGEMFVGKRFAGQDFFHNGHENRVFSGSSFMASVNSQTLKNFYPGEDIALSRVHKSNGVAGHKVHFYSEEASLQNGLAQFIGSALKAGNAAIVVATAQHRNDLLLRLRALGLDVGAAEREGRYISVEAADAISTFTVDNRFDSVRFQQLFADLILKATETAKKEAGRVAVFGECVQLMCARGNAEAAIQMERLGNHLVKTYDVDILCAYPVTQFHKPRSEIFQRICAEHSAVYCG
jgi:DNA-binding NarL/FixJ family response regulator